MLSRTPLYARRVAAALGAPHSRFLSAAPSYLELNEGQKKLSDIVAASPKVLAYFTASWCGPCKAIGPHFAALAKDNGQAVQFVKVDVDDNGATAEEVRWSAQLAGFLGCTILYTLRTGCRLAAWAPSRISPHSLPLPTSVNKTLAGMSPFAPPPFCPGRQASPPCPLSRALRTARWLGSSVAPTRTRSLLLSRRLWMLSLDIYNSWICG